MTYFPSQMMLDALEHAKREFPKESCGLWVGDAYQACFNYAVEPEKDFVIAPEIYLKAQASGGVKGVIHSHPNGPVYPSGLDMEQQKVTAVPWAIISTDGADKHYTVEFGDGVPVASVIGRTFIHGIWDCYSLIRDTFGLGAEALKEQGILGWPYKSIKLPDFPRDDGWWEGPARKNLYTDNFEKAGFQQIDRNHYRPGDVFLCRVQRPNSGSDAVNHGGVLLNDGTIMHHLPTRLSRREPGGRWANIVVSWLRYQDQSQLTDHP
jgi:proteasome lid subunit RPN8/RPN11